MVVLVETAMLDVVITKREVEYVPDANPDGRGMKVVAVAPAAIVSPLVAIPTVCP